MCRDRTGTDDPRTNPDRDEKHPNLTAITDLHRLTDTALPPIVLSRNHGPATKARKKSGFAGSISFGCALVAGRKRVPNPAAGKTAFLTRFSCGAMVSRKHDRGDGRFCR